ncbi:hypothetical protein E5288_WYG008788 [Bos mutus]|uniref:Uncharacterized protein n=1 Tax=Bos mutus TaxID=72004 RepID=A0A6B0RGZ6_9CETA|nr:hypothetical protein [Bos mutus]
MRLAPLLLLPAWAAPLPPREAPNGYPVLSITQVEVGSVEYLDVLDLGNSHLPYITVKSRQRGRTAMDFIVFLWRKPKAKAPLPPAETKCLDASSVDDSVESSAFIMDQKENMTDKDIELLVVLPGDIIKSTTVNGSCFFKFDLQKLC